MTRPYYRDGVIIYDGELTEAETLRRRQKITNGREGLMIDELQ